MEKIVLEFTRGEVFEIIGQLKNEIKANGGIQNTDTDIVTAFYKLQNIDSK
jgi:hypothetical protein